MTAVRRSLVVLALTVAVIVGASLPAQALFADSTAVTTTVSTRTVQPPTDVKVSTYCITTTTTRRTTTSAYGTSTWTTITSESSTKNVDSSTTTTTSGPRAGETTTTTVTEDTELYASATWTRSTSTNVAGYQMTAHLGNGYTWAMLQSANATSMTANADADYLSTSLKLTIDTVTTYGWTASSALSKTLTC
jgi:hypothetical protein